MIDPKYVLIYAAITCRGRWDDIFALLRQKKDLPDPEAIEDIATHYDGHVITIFDEEYPIRLRNTPRPPWALFYEGDISLLKDDSKLIAFTGSHDAESPYAEKKTAEIAKEATKEGAIVVSGLSRGCQSIALTSSLSVGRCVALLGNGIDKRYPIESSDLQSRIAKKGLLLSPYPNGVAPSVEGIRTRNMILGQLAHFLFVGVAKKHDGILLTVASALNVGCDMGCLPFSADSEYINNSLIRNGAAMIESSADLLFEAGLKEAV
ncbi:MAG: DNA-processing protein DprA [Bacilli bacterium]|nr:DNA-processing protein DprA [Bacilli bacterium]